MQIRNQSCFQLDFGASSTLKLSKYVSMIMCPQMIQLQFNKYPCLKVERDGFFLHLSTILFFGSKL